MKAYNVFEANLIDGLIFGLVTLVIPWFFMLPVLGKGFLALNTPRPVFISSLSIWSHVAIGVAIGLFFKLFGY